MILFLRRSLTLLFMLVGIIGATAAEENPDDPITPGTLPIAVRKVYVGEEDVPLKDELEGLPTTTGNPESLRFEVGSRKPEYGTVTVSASGEFTYTPSPNFNGIDSFGFIVKEGELKSSETINSVDVRAVNDAPVPLPFFAVAPAGRPFVGQLQAYDVDHGENTANNLVFKRESGPSALLIEPSGRITYTPADTVPREIVTFSFTVFDGTETVTGSGTLVLGDGSGFVGDSLRAQLAAAVFPPDLSAPEIGSIVSPGGTDNNAIFDMEVDRAGRRLYVLTATGLEAYALPKESTSTELVFLKRWVSIKGTHLALSLDARTAFIAAKGMVTAINLYPESVYSASGLSWVEAYDDAGAGNRRVFELGEGVIKERDIVAMGVHPAGDRLMVVVAGSANKVNVTNDLLRSDVGNGVRYESLADEDLPEDFGYITQLDISSHVETVTRPALAFFRSVDLKELIYTRQKASGTPAVAVGIRGLTFSPDGNCAFLSAVGGQTVRATAFGIMPTTDEGTGGIVVMDVRPRPNADPEDPWIDYLGFIPTTERGEDTAELRMEIRKKGWRIVHPEVQFAQLLHYTAMGIEAITSPLPIVNIPTSTYTMFTSDTLNRLQDSFVDYGYMQAYVDLYPRDMVGASSMAIHHRGDFGIVTLQNTNNLGLISLAPTDRLLGYSADDRPDFFIKQGTGKTVNGFNAALSGTPSSENNYGWAYPQEVAFTSDDSRIFIGMAGGTPTADRTNFFGSANAIALLNEMQRTDESVFASPNPPPGYVMHQTGLFESPRRVATRAGVDYDADRLSDQTEAFNRWNFLREMPGKKEAMVDVGRTASGAELPFWSSHPGYPFSPSSLGEHTFPDDAWDKSFFLPASGLGYRLDAQGDNARLSFNAGSRGAIAAIEQMGRLWHEAYLDEESGLKRPYFVVGMISAPGGGPIVNKDNEELQYGARNGFQVSFPYPSLVRSDASSPAKLSDLAHDFVLLNGAATPAAPGTEVVEPVPVPGQEVDDKAPHPRNNTVEDLAGFDALHAAKLIRLLYGELFDGRFIASRIELDPAVRYLLTEPAISDEKLKIDPKVKEIAKNIDFNSPRFVFRGVRGPASRSRRDLDSSMSVSFSPLALKVEPAPPPESKESETPTPPPSGETKPPPTSVGLHTFVVTLPDIPSWLHDDVKIWLPPFTMPNGIEADKLFVVRDKQGDIIKIGEKYTLDELYDAPDPINNPNNEKRITLSVSVDPRDEFDWQLALEIFSPTAGSVFSLRDRFEYIQWSPESKPRLKLAVMQKGDQPNIEQVTQVKAEVFGFSSDIIYRRVKWVRASYLAATRKPSEPFIDPNTGEIVAGEDPGTLTLVAEAKTPEGEKVVSTPLEIKVGFVPQESSAAVGRIVLGTYEDRLQIEVNDGADRSVVIRAGEKGKDLMSDHAVTFPQANGHEVIKFNREGNVRQVFTPYALFDVVYEGSSNSGYKLSTYKVPDPDFEPEYDPVEGLYELGGLGDPLSSLTVKGSPTQVNITTDEEGRSGDHQYHVISDHAWELSEFLGEGASYLRKRAVVVEEGDTGTSITRTVSDSTGVLSKEVELHQLPNEEEGPRISLSTLDPDGTPHVTRHEYDGSHRLTKTEYPDGRWERFEYDEHGRVLAHFEPWLNARSDAGAGECKVTRYTYDDPGISGIRRPQAARTTSIEIKGVQVSSQQDEYVEENGALVHRMTVKTGNSAPLTTVTTHFPLKVSEDVYHEFGDRVKTVRYPDNTVETYEYQVARDVLGRVKEERTIVERNRNDHGIITTTITDGQLREVASKVVDIASDLTLEDRKAVAFDRQGRATKWEYLDGSSSSAIYGPHGPLSEKDALGLVSTYTYDALGRIATEERMGVEMRYERDALGRELKVYREGSLISQTQYLDMMGNKVDSFDALNRKTESRVSYNADGSTIRTTSLPGGLDRWQVVAADGNVLSAGGSATAPVDYEYRIDSALGYACLVSKAFALPSASASSSSEWTETWTDMLGRVVRSATPDGSYSEYAYNDEGQLIRSTDPDGVNTLLEYDESGELSVTAIDTNRNGSIDFGGEDRVTREHTQFASRAGTVVARTTTELWHSDSSSPLQVGVLDQGIDGFSTWYTSFDNVSGEEWTFPGGRNGSWEVKSTDSDGSYTVAKYSSGRLESSTSYGPGGERVARSEYGYDNHGRLSATTDLRGGTTSISYYDDDQIMTVTAPHPEAAGSLVTTHHYDDRGLLEQRVLPDGSTTHYDYTPLGQLKSVSGSQTYPLDYDYDAQGRLTKLTTRQGAGGGTSVTSWRYNPALGNLAAKRDQLGKEVTYDYTKAGRLRTRTWARGVSTTFGYHGDGSLAEVDYSDATPDLAYAYHRHGAVKEVRAGSSATPHQRHAYGFDSKLRPATETISTRGDHTLTRNYEGSGTRYLGFTLSGALLPTAQSQSYSYDGAGRFSSVQSPAGTFTYGYLADSALVDTLTGPAHVVRNTHQSKGYGLMARENKAGETVVSRFGYRTNNLGQRTDQTRTGVAFAQPSHFAYRYDSKGQLIRAERFQGANPDEPGAPILPETFHYDFDDIGNRLTATRGALSEPLIKETYTTNLLNQYTGIAVAGAGPPEPLPRTFVHDDDGNLVNDGRWRYEWDGENRLIRAEEIAPSAGRPARRLDFEYDYQGRRVNKTSYTYNAVTALWSKAAEIHFLYDGWNLVAEVDVATPSDPKLLRTYAWGSDMSGELQGAGGVGGLLALVEHPAAQDPLPPPIEGAEPPPPPEPRTFFPTYDGGGNISEWLDKTGAIVAHQEYGPFGEIIRQSGLSAGRFAFGFSTKYTDAETGLLYYGYRYYAPDTGRWLSRDPLEEQGGANLYGFNTNDPANEIDPLGQSPISVVAKWAVKLGVKKAIKEYVENRIKKEILGAIRGRAYKKAAKELGEEALKILDTMDSAWWEVAIELIPVGGDIYGTGKFAIKLREVNRRLEDLERRAGKLAADAAEFSAKHLKQIRAKGLPKGIRSYVKDVEVRTGRKLHGKQVDELKDALRNKRFSKLSKDKTDAHRKDFDKVKDDLITEWEKQTGQTWPRYTEGLPKKNGKPGFSRDAGDPYDAHHLIENELGGPAKWWNIHPAKFPDEHQGGIHKKGGALRRLLGNID